jgi:hypothetical protein
MAWAYSPMTLPVTARATGMPGRVVARHRNAHQALLGERRLADQKVQVGLGVDREVDLAALDIEHGLGHISGGSVASATLPPAVTGSAVPPAG